jgi:hypothetical protein
VPTPERDFGKPVDPIPFTFIHGEKELFETEISKRRPQLFA